MFVVTAARSTMRYSHESNLVNRLENQRLVQQCTSPPCGSSPQTSPHTIVALFGYEHIYLCLKWLFISTAFSPSLSDFLLMRHCFLLRQRIIIIIFSFSPIFLWFCFWDCVSELKFKALQFTWEIWCNWENGPLFFDSLWDWCMCVFFLFFFIDFLIYCMLIQLGLWGKNIRVMVVHKNNGLFRQTLGYWCSWQ